MTQDTTAFTDTESLYCLKYTQNVVPINFQQNEVNINNIHRRATDCALLFEPHSTAADTPAKFQHALLLGFRAQ